MVRSPDETLIMRRGSWIINSLEKNEFGGVLLLNWGIIGI